MSSSRSGSTAIAIWAGIDVAAATMEVAVDPPFDPACDPVDFHAVKTKTFNRTEAGVAAMAEWVGQQAAAHGMQPSQVRVVMESTGTYSLELACWIAESYPSMKPAIVNARCMADFARSHSPRHKTDRSDARIIARYGTNNRPHPYDIPTPFRQRLIALVRHRESLVAQRTAVKNRMRVAMIDRDVKASLERQAKFLDAEIKRFDTKIRKHYSKDKALAEDIALLKTISGVGEITAVTVAAELGDLRRFEKARQATSFAGLTPRRTQTGTSTDRGGPIVKIGSSRARRVLLMAAWAAVRTAGPLQDEYNRMVARGKRKLQAGVAIMRKLIVLMRAILISGRSYDPGKAKAS